MHRKVSGVSFSLLVFLVWAVLFVAWPGYTLHTVDNVRDFRVAMDIASGAVWPAASQPFAGRWQLPPLYFHLLALPLRIWPNEYAVFLFSGVFAAAAIATLAASLRRAVGTTAAAIYAAFAAPAHAAVVFPGVSNPALAFAFVTLMLAAWFHLRTRPAVATPALLVTGWCAVLMHPSALALVAPTIIASGFVASASWRRKPSWIAVLLLAIVSVGWVSQHGVLAPEIRPEESVIGNDWVAVFSRLSSASHWATLWATPWLHVLALEDLNASVGRILVYAAAAAMAAGALLACFAFGSSLAPECRPLRLVAATSALVATAFLATWGFWYLDSLWPVFAVLAAVGWSRLRMLGGPSGYGLAMLAALAAISLPVMVKSIAVRTERYSVGVRGMFFPAMDRTGVLKIPLASALIRYRAFVANRGGCDSSRFVGIDEFWLRDLTLRFAIADCKAAAAAPGLPSRFLVNTGAVADASSAQQSFSDIRLTALPLADVSVDGASSGEILSWAPGLRYSYYEPATLRPGVEIRARIRASPAQEAAVDRSGIDTHLFVAFRCLAAGAANIEAALASQTPLSLNRERTLSPFYYAEFLTPVDSAGDAVITIKSALSCDVAAWADQATTRR